MTSAAAINETTTDQVYLRHIRMELQNVTAALRELTQVLRIQTVVQAAGSESGWSRVPYDWTQYPTESEWQEPLPLCGVCGITGHESADCPTREKSEEPDIDDEPPPDYGPPGTGAVIVEYD